MLFVWKLDHKRTKLTRRIDIVKIQARNEGDLDYHSTGGVLKSGCNPDVQESLVFASVLFMILYLKGLIGQKPSISVAKEEHRGSDPL